MNGTFYYYSEEIWRAEVLCKFTILENAEIIAHIKDYVVFETAYRLSDEELEGIANEKFLECYPMFEEDNLAEAHELRSSIIVESYKKVNG